jgi:hypothetical protein
MNNDAMDILDPIVFCSKCFEDEGLRYYSEKIGRNPFGACPACGHSDGSGLTESQLGEIAERFFVNGTVSHGVGSYSPVFRIGGDPPGHEPDFLDHTLRDLERIKSRSEIVLHFRSPKFWQLGLTYHWEQDSNGNFILSTAEAVRATEACQKTILRKGATIYRARLGLEDEKIFDEDQYDSPKNSKKKFDRFDSAGVRIFYSSSTIETCLREVRLSIHDPISIASLEVLDDLKLLDTTANAFDYSGDEFDNPAHFFRGLAYSTNKQGENQQVSRVIAAAGYDGFVYRSYHKSLLQKDGHNVALFGRPISEGKLRVRSINTVFISSLNVEYQLGPVIKPFNEPFVNADSSIQTKLKAAWHRFKRVWL